MLSLTGGGAAVNAEKAPLKLFWSPGRGDYLLTSAGEQNARSAGYAFAGVESYVLNAP